MVALIIKIAAILFAIWMIYSQDLVMVKNEATQSELMTYLLAIPFLFAYLIYRGRKMIRAVIPFEAYAPIKKTVPTCEIIGAMLCLLAFLLYWQGSYTLYPLECHIASLPLFVAGLVLLMFNAQTLKVLAFPIAFLLFLIPPPHEIVYATGATLAAYTSEVVYTILKALGSPVSLTTQFGSPVLILEKSGTSPLTFAIDTPFATVYPLIVFTVFAAFVAFIVRGAAWKRAIMFLVGFPLICSLNIMRIIIMILIGYQYGAEATIGTVQIVVSWFLVFIGTFFLLFCASGKILKIPIFAKKSKPAPCSNCGQSLENRQNFCLVCGKVLRYFDIKLSKRDLFKIVALTISVSLVTLLEVPALALRNGNIQVITLLPSGVKTDTPVLPEVTGYTLQFDYSNETIEEMVESNVSLTYVYTSADETMPTIWGIVEIADSKSIQALRGEILDLRDVQLLQNPSIIGRFASLRKLESNLTLVILGWYEKATFDTESGAVQKYAKISIFAFTNNSSNYVRVEENLLAVGQAIAGYWEPIRAGSWSAPLIYHYGYVLSAIVLVFLAAILTVQTVDLRREKKRNLKAFSKLALEDEKNVLRAVYQAGKNGKSTTNAIALFFHNLAGKSIEQNGLLETLKYAEEAGLVKRSIANEKDEPTLVWKSQIDFLGSKSYLQRIRKLIGIDRILARLGCLYHCRRDRNA